MQRRELPVFGLHQDADLRAADALDDACLIRGLQVAHDGLATSSVACGGENLGGDFGCGERAAYLPERLRGVHDLFGRTCFYRGGHPEHEAAGVDYQPDQALCQFCCFVHSLRRLTEAATGGAGLRRVISHVRLLLHHDM